MFVLPGEDFYLLVVGHHDHAVVLADVEEVRVGDRGGKLVDLSGAECGEKEEEKTG